MDQEIGQWTPFGSRLESLPANWQTSVQNLLTEANTMIDDNPAFASSQPISQLLKLVVRSNEDMEIKKCWPLQVVKKEVRFDPAHSRFVYTNKFDRDTILKPKQVRQCVLGTLQGHISGCPIRRQDFEEYLGTLSEDKRQRDKMDELLVIIQN